MPWVVWSVVRACVVEGEKGGTDWTGQEGRVPVGTVNNCGQGSGVGKGTRKALMRRGNCTLQLDAGRYRWIEIGDGDLRSVFLRGCPRSGTRMRNRQAGVFCSGFRGLRSGGSCRFFCQRDPSCRHQCDCQGEEKQPAYPRTRAKTCEDRGARPSQARPGALGN